MIWGGTNPNPDSIEAGRKRITLETQRGGSTLNQERVRVRRNSIHCVGCETKNNGTYKWRKSFESHAKVYFRQRA